MASEDLLQRLRDLGWLKPDPLQRLRGALTSGTLILRALILGALTATADQCICGVWACFTFTFCLFIDLLLIDAQLSRYIVVMSGEKHFLKRTRAIFIVLSTAASFVGLAVGEITEKNTLVRNLHLRVITLACHL